jgi:isopentenyldiphosphate isomerase
MTIESEELIDIVNEKNEVIGQAKRGDAHKKGLLHRTAVIFLFNSKGELLVQKRSQKKNDSPGKFDYSAAGHVQAGESHESGAKSELKEELGLECKLKEEFTEFQEFKKQEKHMRHLAKIYSCVYDGKINFNPEEIDSVQFIKPKELLIAMKKEPEKFASSLKLTAKKMLKDKKPNELNKTGKIPR